ncbi:uncharacterized protein [Asterias amurensis]|uniref:uncharacterized protein n=1 Tax=Asterias amurensis TaxID=7602 RepID=UPI003AB7A71B
MEEQAGRSGSGGSSSGGNNNSTDQGSFAEVTVIDSQFQHFSSYIEVIRVFKCRLCTFCSPLEHVIASHMSEVHFPRRCFLCKQCLFVFEDRAQLVSHLDSAHGTKSIAVCFGDNVNGGYSSPPPSLSMMMRTTEGEERIAQQMAEETGVEETSGRVTSSTGNLANLAEGVPISPIPTDCTARSGAPSRKTPPEGGRASEPPAIIIDSRQDQLQSRSSSCHPSSSNQVYSSPDIIDCEAPNSRLEVPSRQQQPPVSLPPNAELRVTIGNTYCQSYIKTEPISPVRSAESHPKPKSRPFLSRSRHDPRSYMRRWSLTENSSPEDAVANANSRMSRSFDIPGSGSGLQNGIEEVEDMNTEKDVRDEGAQKSSHINGEVIRESSSDVPENGEISNKAECNKSAEERGRMIEKSKSMDAVRETRTLLGGSKSYQGGRSVDGRPPRLVRQSVVEESPGNSPLPRVMSQEDSSSPEKSDRSHLTVPFSGAEMMRRENFSRSFPGTSGKPSVEPHQNQKPSEGSQNFRHTLRDLVSSRIEHGERQQQQQHQATAPHTSESNQFANLAVSNAAATWMRAGRVRSYSISEGEMRGFQANLHPDGTHLKPVEGQMVPGALERDQATNGHSRLPPGHPQMPHGLHHYPGGLVYQPFSIEGEPKHLRYYNQGPRMASQNSVDGLPHPARVRLEENGQHPIQNQPMEESFLYKFLRNNGGRKHRRNSVSMGSEGPAAALMSPHGAPPRGFIPHPEGVEPIGFDRHRGLPWPPPRHHHPDHPFPQQSPFPSHMAPYQMGWKDKLDASQVSPNTSVNGEQRPGVEYGSVPEREPSGRGDSGGVPNGVVVIDGKVIRAKQAEGGESNQDLAKDITRQVQQVMGGTQPLYNSTDRHMPPWMEGNDRPESPDDPMDGDSAAQRRSRKSTFNIYREIPERKRKLDHDEEEKIKHSYNADGSFDYFSLTGWKAYKCDLCKKRRFKTASELQEHKQRKHGLERSHSSQGSLNGIPEGGLNPSMMEINEPNDSPASG